MLFITKFCALILPIAFWLLLLLPLTTFRIMDFLQESILLDFIGRALFLLWFTGQDPVYRYTESGFRFPNAVI